MILIFLLEVLVSFQAQAQSRVNQAFEACLSSQPQKKQCQFIDLDKLSNPAVKERKFLEIAPEILIKTTIINFFNITGAVQCRFNNKCRNTLSEFENKLYDLKKFIVANALNSCQTACLINCITSKTIEYRKYTQSKVSGIGTIVSSGEGECTEFSRLSNYIGEEVGLPTNVQLSLIQRHAYTSQRIDGIWYFSEPDSDSCDFYYSKSKEDRSLKNLSDLQAP